MTEARFLQIHYLTAYPSALLNRDDVGFAKRIPFGGASRIRISSQCLKRHWREAMREDGELGASLSVRSRHIFDREIARPLIEEEKLDKDLVELVLKKVQDLILGKSKKREGKTEEETTGTGLETPQVIVLGRPEIDYIKRFTIETIKGGDRKSVEGKLKKLEKDKNWEENWKALGKAAMGLDAALFGRMVTSDILARGDAAVHVAHAFTVHEEEAETDYFTAVDDLVRESGELGSGHINESELTSGLFYGYVVVDLPLLEENLGGDRELASKVVKKLVEWIATVSPGAKRGSTAPYSYAQFMLCEAGKRQPRTLANAFMKPVPLDCPEGLWIGTIRAVAKHLSDLDRMYGRHEERKATSMFPLDGVPADPVENMDKLATWAAGCRGKK